MSETPNRTFAFIADLWKLSSIQNRLHEQLSYFILLYIFYLLHIWSLYQSINVKKVSSTCFHWWVAEQLSTNHINTNLTANRSKSCWACINTIIYTPAHTAHTELIMPGMSGACDNLWLQWFPLEVDTIGNEYSIILMSQPHNCTLICIHLLSVLADVYVEQGMYVVLNWLHDLNKHA